MDVDLRNPFEPPITFSGKAFLASDRHRNRRAQHATAQVFRQTLSFLPHQDAMRGSTDPPLSRASVNASLRRVRECVR
jgi:hypothetical protein